MLERSLRMISFTARKREERVLGKRSLIANLQVNSRECQQHISNWLYSVCDAEMAQNTFSRAGVNSRTSLSLNDKMLTHYNIPWSVLLLRGWERRCGDLPWSRTSLCLGRFICFSKRVKSQRPPQASDGHYQRVIFGRWTGNERSSERPQPANSTTFSPSPPCLSRPSHLIHTKIGNVTGRLSPRPIF